MTLTARKRATSIGSISHAFTAMAWTHGGWTPPTQTTTVSRNQTSTKCDASPTLRQERTSKAHGDQCATPSPLNVWRACMTTSSKLTQPNVRSSSLAATSQDSNALAPTHGAATWARHGTLSASKCPYASTTPSRPTLMSTPTLEASSPMLTTKAGMTTPPHTILYTKNFTYAGCSLAHSAL